MGLFEDINGSDYRNTNSAAVTHLVCSDNETEVVLFIELSHNISTKCVRHTSVILTPACDVLQNVYTISELQIRGGNEDYSNIIFLISQRKHVVTPN